MTHAHRVCWECWNRLTMRVPWWHPSYYERQPGVCCWCFSLVGEKIPLTNEPYITNIIGGNICNGEELPK